MEKIKKIFILFIFIFLLFAHNAYAEIVKKIDIKGNDRISSETILYFWYNRSIR